MCNARPYTALEDEWGKRLVMVLLLERQTNNHPLSAPLLDDAKEENRPARKNMFKNISAKQERQR